MPSSYILIFLCFQLSFVASTSQYSTKTDSLELALLEATDLQAKIDALIGLAELNSSSNTEQALDFAYRALDLSIKNELQNKELEVYLTLSSIFLIKSDYSNSLEYANKAKRLASILGLKNEYAQTLLLVAKVYSNIGDYDKSSELVFESFKIFELLNDKMGVSKALGRIGFNYFEMENYEKALEYHLQSLKISRELNDFIGIAKGLNNVAAVHSGMGNWEGFKSNMREAARINQKTGMQEWEGINYLNLGYIYMNERSFDSSMLYYNKSLEIFTKTNNYQELTSLFVNISILYFYLENYDSSLFYAKKAYNMGLRYNLKKNTYNATRLMHEIFKDQGDCENAYKYSQLESQMKDSLDIEKSTLRLLQLELLYDFEKIEQENKVKQQQRESMFIFFGFVVFSIIGLIVIIVIARIRLKRKNDEIERQKLKTELELRNKELTSNAMSIMKKNEILSDIAGKLMDLRESAVKDETKFAIKRIVKELQSTKDKEIWKEFDIRFKQVNNDFYNKLITRFPDLTPSEQRLCAFLRLNMTTKEISELTGQRTGTIEMARSSVRKKIGIAHDQTNLVTFLTQL